MSAVFLRILNMGIAAGWLILAVVLLRFFLKKAPKWISCLLWALAAVRLLCPFSPESALSLVPSRETVPMDIALAEAPAIHSGIPVLNAAVNPAVREVFAPEIGDSANPLQVLLPILAGVWLLGVAAMLGYALVSYGRLRRTVTAAVPLEEGVLACDEVQSPFILGVIRPMIYVPSGMSGRTLDCVLTHERAHLRRRDHLWKPLGFLLLAVYWFHPLCWLGYVLLCRDIELACDEKVIRDMDREAVAAYSQALLDCSVPRKGVAACPLAFGETGLRQRVKGILNYKKPAFWVVAASLVLCAAVAVCFLTNRPVSLRGIRLTGAVSLDMRPPEPLVWNLTEAELEELQSRLEALKIGKKEPDFAGFTPLYSISASSGRGTLLAAGYDTEGKNLALLLEGQYYRIRDPEFTRYLSNFCAGNTRGAAEPAAPGAAPAPSPLSLEELREQYLEYFGLSAFKGLEVYVWQLAPGSYSWGLMEGTNREKTNEELWNLRGTSTEEMRTILSAYDVPEENVFIQPIRKPYSSYLPPAEAMDPARLRELLFGSPGIRGKVAWAGYPSGESIGAIFAGCLNHETLVMSAVHHIPVYRVDARTELDAFTSDFGEILTLDRGHEEAPSFLEATAGYDDAFFAEHSLVLAYVQAASGSFRYGLQDVIRDGDSFCMVVVQTNDPETYTSDMAGWLVLAEVPKELIRGCTRFDARQEPW